MTSRFFKIFSSISPFFLLSNAYNQPSRPFSHFLLPDSPLSQAQLQSRKQFFLDNLNCQLGSQQNNLYASKIASAIYDAVEQDSIQGFFDISTIRSFTLALYTYLSSLDHNIDQLNHQQILDFYHEFCTLLYHDLDDDFP